ncbi:MAG: hypothetical protein ACREP9_08385 [Candidatus Dormibacteraceae bacterium]
MEKKEQAEGGGPSMQRALGEALRVLEEHRVYNAVRLRLWEDIRRVMATEQGGSVGDVIYGGPEWSVRWEDPEVAKLKEENQRLRGELEAIRGKAKMATKWKAGDVAMLKTKEGRKIVVLESFSVAEGKKVEVCKCRSAIGFTVYYLGESLLTPEEWERWRLVQGGG